MLTVRLLDDQSGSEQRSGPLERVTVEGDVVILPGHEPARYSEGRWLLGKQSLLSFEITAPAQIELRSDVRDSIVRGPFDAVRIVGGALHVWSPQRSPFARLNVRTALWSLFADASDWSSMLITPATGLQPANDNVRED